MPHFFHALFAHHLVWCDVSLAFFLYSLASPFNLRINISKSTHLNRNERDKTVIKRRIQTDNDSIKMYVLCNLFKQDDGIGGKQFIKFTLTRTHSIWNALKQILDGQKCSCSPTSCRWATFDMPIRDPS